jgi:enoyl-CoA hydratase
VAALMRLMETAMPPAEGTITTERRGPLLLIGINRPAKRNGFTPRMFRELAEAYTLLDDEPALRVGVLFGHGEHFTAGLDLPTIAPSMQKGEKLWPHDAVEPLNLGTPGYRRRTKPMVVAVQGITFTLGIELMLAADIVVASEDCRFSQLEVKRGIMATGGATLRMAQRAGLGNAMLHLLTGDEFGAAEALRLNFVQKVAAKGQQLQEAVRIAEAVAEQAPLAVVATRLNALKAVERGPLEAMAEFVSVQQRLSRTGDAAEGVKSFVEKRPARFTGR